MVIGTWTTVETPQICTSLLSLPVPILEVILEQLSTHELVSLASCHSSLYYFCNARLYENILITENKLIVPRSGSFKLGGWTILKKQRLLEFLDVVTNNRYLRSCIHNVSIITSSSLGNSTLTNEYDTLYYLLLSKNSRLKFLENLDYNNVKRFENFLQFNQACISQRNLRKYLLYENDDLTVNPAGLLSKIWNLKNYQISSLNDFKLIPVESGNFTKLSILIEQVYNERIDIDDFQLNESLLKKFQYLQVLELNSSISTEIFITKLFNLPQGTIKFHNLQTLSITYVHSIRSQFDMMLDLIKLGKIFPFSRLQNLELKLNCDDMNCQICIETFMEILRPQLTNLVKLSIIYITNENLLANSRIDFDPTNLNNNRDTEHLLIWSKAIFGFHQLPKLKYLYINLNDFTFIPILKLNSDNINNHNSVTIFNFNIPPDFLARKKFLLDRISEAPLETLIIPDYFYNWKLFDSSVDDVEDGLQFLSYLNKCDCLDCHNWRNLFKMYSEINDAVSDFEVIPDLMSQNAKFFVKGKISPKVVKNYRFFYNSFIRNLKQRLPCTDKIFKNQSGLNILDKPFNEFSLLGADGKEYDCKKRHYGMFIKLIVHNLRDDLRYFLDRNNKLRNLVLGGIFFAIEPLNQGQYKCKGVYDDFNIVV